MTRLLLDTTFLIDGERSGGSRDEVIDDDDDVAITVAELRVGALLVDRRRKSARVAYVDDIVASIPVLDYGIEVAEAHASLLVDVGAQGRPRGAHDLIIAATAKAFDRTVLTADRAAFGDLNGVTVRSHRCATL